MNKIHVYQLIDAVLIGNFIDDPFLFQNWNLGQTSFVDDAMKQRVNDMVSKNGIFDSFCLPRNNIRKFDFSQGNSVQNTTDYYHLNSTGRILQACPFTCSTKRLHERVSSENLPVLFSTKVDLACNCFIGGVHVIISISCC